MLRSNLLFWFQGELKPRRGVSRLACGQKGFTRVGLHLGENHRWIGKGGSEFDIFPLWNHHFSDRSTGGDGPHFQLSAILQRMYPRFQNQETDHFARTV